ncbi:MAG: hypothetical protein ABI566_04315 [Pseudolysinimonas sp.]
MGPRFIVTVIICTLVAGLTGGLVGWGVSSATIASATGAAGADGTNGEDGADGAPGADGVDGATGPAGPQGPAGSSTGTPGPRGATGATGATGADGATGLQGPAGVQGVPGVPGTPGQDASANSFSYTSASGTFPVFSSNFTAGTIAGPVPAGPALVGFSIKVTSLGFAQAISCELVDGLGNTYGTTGFISMTTGTPLTLDATLVITVPTASTLSVACTAPYPDPFAKTYTDLSIYAISFGP